MLVVGNPVRAECPAGVGKLQRRDLQKRLHPGGQRRQDGFEVNRQQPEGLDADAAHIVQCGQFGGVISGVISGVSTGVSTRLPGQLPGFVLVDVSIHPVGQQHGFTHRTAKLTGIKQFFDAAALGAQPVQQQAALHPQIG